MARFLAYRYRQNYAIKQHFLPPSHTNGRHKRLAQNDGEGHITADLEQGIVGSAPAAERLGDVMQLLPRILLRKDGRVRTAFAVW